MNRPAATIASALLFGASFLSIAMIGPRAMSKEPRFPQLSMEQLTDAQKPLGEEIMKVSSVGLGGPYNPLLRSPVLGQRMLDLWHYLRWETSVPLKLNEFAILIVARQWRSQVEWFAHAPLAIKAGLSPDIVAELKANKRPTSMLPEEAAVYDFVTELTTKHAITDETFTRAKKLLGEQQVVDLTAVAGMLYRHGDATWRWPSRAYRLEKKSHLLQANPDTGSRFGRSGATLRLNPKRRARYRRQAAAWRFRPQPSWRCRRCRWKNRIAAKVQAARSRCSGSPHQSGA